MDVFEAIADPNRRKIIALLRRGELPAGALVDSLDISQPGVSKHLKCLREAGVVKVRGDGQRRLYRIEHRKLAEVDAWLEPYRQFWGVKLDKLNRHLEREQ